MAVVENEENFEAGKITLWRDDVLVGTETALSDVEIPNNEYDTVKVGNGAKVSGLIVESGAKLIVDKEAIIESLILGGSSSSNYIGGVYQGGGIAKNNTGWYGGAICASTATVILVEAVFESNSVTALNGSSGLGGAIETYGGTLNITDCSFTGNTAGGDTAAGGAVCAIAGANVTVDGGTFTENEAAYGGALQQWGGTLTITSTEFTDNIARIGGGALEMHGAVTASVDACVFTGNDAVHGGAVYNDTYNNGTANLTLKNSTLNKNTADLGGAVYNYADLLIQKSNFSENEVNLPAGWNTDKGFGGAVANTISGNLIVEESVFEANTAKNGGAIANWINYGESGSATAEISDSSFESNAAENGGAIYQSGASADLVKITDCDFIGNTASYGGGAVVNAFGLLQITGGSFEENTAANDGGAVALWNGGSISDAVFSGNNAAYGGAVSNSWSGPAVTISGCTFTANTATVSGGAIWNDNNGCEIISVSDCTFSGNSASVSGGAIFNENKMTLKNTSFTTSTDTICNTGVLTLSGKNTFAAAVENSGKVIFDLSTATTASDAVVNDLSFFSGSLVIMVSSTQATGTYKLADAVSADIGHLIFTIQDVNGNTLDQICLSDTAGKLYSLSCSNSGSLLLNIGEQQVSQNIFEVPDDAEIIELFLKNDESSAVRIMPVSGKDLVFYNLPDDTLCAEAKDDAENVIGETEIFTDTVNPEGESRIVTAAADGRSDVFFVHQSTQVWTSQYEAQHLGCKGGWRGTEEKVQLNGKNVVGDIFNGAVNDVNILLLTDSENGDALFVDDIYGASYLDAGRQQSRLANVDEIRAGAGNDLVDLTSQRFAYIGGGMTVRGGSGNDTIWANSGENMLFGDAGNDRIVGAADMDWIAGGAGDDSLHGGGGNDIFAFCGDWGNDTVEQLSNGSVTLWFQEGSAENWNETEMCYSDGENTVKVSGVSIVNLKFGDDGSELFDRLNAVGAFLSETSEKIFEEKGSDSVLAVL